MQQPPPPASKLSPNAITTEQIQKCLEDNKNLIMAIMENQNLGKFQECAQYQAVLQKNLMYLAAIADTHPPPPTPTPTPQIPNQSQGSPSLPPGFMPQQPNNFMQQPQPVAPQLPIGGGQKLPFQLNSLRTQDQQQQLLQFQQQQQQQQQQLQAQMGLRPGGGGGGGQGGLFGMHQVMNHGGGDLINGQGSKQDGSEGNRDS